MEEKHVKMFYDTMAKILSEKYGLDIRFYVEKKIPSKESRKDKGNINSINASQLPIDSMGKGA